MTKLTRLSFMRLTSARIAKRINFRVMKEAGRLSDLWNQKADLAWMLQEKSRP